MRNMILLAAMIAVAGCGSSVSPTEFESWKGTFIYECASGCDSLASGEKAGEGKIAAMSGKYVAVFVDGELEKNNVALNVGGGPYGDLDQSGSFEVESDGPPNDSGQNAIRCDGSFSADGKAVLEMSCSILDICEDPSDPECFEKTESCDEEGFHIGGNVTATCGEKKYFKKSADVGPISFNLICTSTKVGECPEIE
jgi:hypothetical protein